MNVNLNNDRLKRLFWSVLYSLPEQDQATLQRVVSNVTDQEKPLKAIEYGTAIPYPKGYEVQLYPNLLSLADDNAVKGVIAHELAHAFLGQVGGEDLSDLVRIHLEVDANHQARAWGLPNIATEQRRYKELREISGKYYDNF